MKTLLIDSSALCYRAVYAVGNLEHDGLETGVTYGFFKQLFTILKKVQADQLIFFWDSKSSKRKELLKGYKKKEDKTEIEQELWNSIYNQFHTIRDEILPAIGLVNNFMQEGYESDDLIAQYVLNKDSDEQACIVTGDDDLLQLLTDSCYIYNVNKKQNYTKEDFRKEYNIEPEQWAKVKQIAGCTSDKVPGVSGVGTKTAIKYIKGELKSTHKTYQRIIQNQDLIDFNHQLVALPFKNALDARELIKHNVFSMKRFLQLCREYGFYSFRTDKRKEEIRILFKSFTNKGVLHGKEERSYKGKTSTEEKNCKAKRISSIGKEKRKRRKSSHSD